MTFKGFALLKDKLLVADSQRMEVASFQIAEPDASRIVGDLAVGNRDSIQQLGQPIHAQRFDNDQELLQGFTEELTTMNISPGANGQTHARSGAVVT